MNKPTPTPASNQNFKIGALVGLTLVALVLLFVLLPAFTNSQDTISINKLATAVEQGNVRSITVHDDTHLSILMSGGVYQESTKEASVDLIQLLAQLGVDKDHLNSFDYRVESGSNSALLLNLLITIGPMVISRLSNKALLLPLSTR